jgi:hypothetical protein
MAIAQSLQTKLCRPQLQSTGQYFAGKRHPLTLA